MRVTVHPLTVSNQKATANYVPAAAVIRRWQALSGFIGRKASAGGFLSLMKAPAQPGRVIETGRLECRRGSGVPCVDIYGGTPVAKAALWSVTDAEARKRGEQTGLDTLVVHAVNDEC